MKLKWKTPFAIIVACMVIPINRYEFGDGIGAFICVVITIVIMFWSLVGAIAMDKESK